MGTNITDILRTWDKLMENHGITLITKSKGTTIMNDWNNYYFSIVSPELSVNSVKENTEARIDLLTRLHAQGISWKEVEGVYQGVSEASFIIKNQKIGRKTADFYGKESVLEVYRQKNGIQIAYLYFPSTKEELYLGQFSTIASTEGVTAYTKDPMTGLVFGIV